MVWGFYMLKSNIDVFFVTSFLCSLKFLGPLDLLPWRVVGRSVCLSVRPSTPLTRQPMLGFFSKLVGIFLG